MRVVLCVGTWIEMYLNTTIDYAIICHLLRGGVD